MKYITFITCLFGLNLLNGQSKITDENFNWFTRGYWETRQNKNLSLETKTELIELRNSKLNIEIEMLNSYVRPNGTGIPHQFRYYLVRINEEIGGVLMRSIKDGQLLNQLFFEYGNESPMVNAYNAKQLSLAFLNNPDVAKRMIVGATKAMSYIPN